MSIEWIGSNGVITPNTPELVALSNYYNAHSGTEKTLAEIEVIRRYTSLFVNADDIPEFLLEGILDRKYTDGEMSVMLGELEKTVQETEYSIN